jgi:hypothetical protein
MLRRSSWERISNPDSARRVSGCAAGNRADIVEQVVRYTRVGRVERLNRDLGQRHVDRRSECRDRAEKRELATVVLP